MGHERNYGMIEAALTLRKVVEPMGHEVVNYGMYAADDAAQLTYVQCGILAAILLNSGAADYVITGCGTGEGAMLALNSFPGVICGHVEDPVDAYTFAHVNDGNAVAMPFAKGFGWGGELNLEYCFEKLFGFGHGQGYPKERVVPEQRNKKILDGVRAATFKPLIECLKSIDQDLLKGAVAGAKFLSCSSPPARTRKLAAPSRPCCNLPHLHDKKFRQYLPIYHFPTQGSVRPGPGKTVSAREKLLLR